MDGAKPARSPSSPGQGCQPLARKARERKSSSHDVNAIELKTTSQVFLPEEDVIGEGDKGRKETNKWPLLCLLLRSRSQKLPKPRCGKASSRIKSAE